MLLIFLVADVGRREMSMGKVLKALRNILLLLLFILYLSLSFSSSCVFSSFLPSSDILVQFCMGVGTAYLTLGESLRAQLQRVFISMEEMNHVLVVQMCAQH